MFGDLNKNPLISFGAFLGNLRNSSIGLMGSLIVLPPMNIQLLRLCLCIGTRLRINFKTSWLCVNSRWGAISQSMPHQLNDRASPPIRFCASITVERIPRCFSNQATLKPEIPPPKIMMSLFKQIILSVSQETTECQLVWSLLLWVILSL